MLSCWCWNQRSALRMSAQGDVIYVSEIALLSIPGKLRCPTREESGTHCHVWRRRLEQRLRRAAAMGWGKGQGRGKTLAKAGECMERIRAGRSGRGRLPTAKLIVATQHCAVADRVYRWIRLFNQKNLCRLIPLTRPCSAVRCNSIYPCLGPERRGIEGRVLPRGNPSSRSVDERFPDGSPEPSCPAHG